MPICRNVQALAGYTPGEQPSDPDIIKLNTNENPYPPSPKVAEALASFDYRKLRLYPDPLFHAVRERIAEINGCRSGQVFVGNGSDEVLALFTRAFVETPDGTIGYFDPTYSLYPVLTEIRDSRKSPVALPDDFTWRMPEDYDASAFILTNPNAPTGIAFPRDVVAAFCRKFRGIVLIDEAYADFADANCMDIATSPENANTLVMRTLSKSFSLAGLRFGYCIGPEPLIEALFKIKDSYNMDWFSQTLGLAALNDLDSMRANVAKIRATRERVATELRGLGWHVLPSQTNFLFAEPPGHNAAEVFEALKRKHIYVRYFPAPRTAPYLRITIGTDAQMDALLQAVAPE
ncbi:MAG: aminotransferase class I/II-fold pyridoxal phosphate-dependent enzyme [Kiritimatiellae bacterium]|nr:aminotransferase class I/II-fold pyridoxal phosphate-dependent enzyme [Kiritimatiellia bacterium]